MEGLGLSRSEIQYLFVRTEIEQEFLGFRKHDGFPSAQSYVYIVFVLVDCFEKGISRTLRRHSGIGPLDAAVVKDEVFVSFGIFVAPIIYAVISHDDYHCRRSQAVLAVLSVFTVLAVLAVADCNIGVIGKIDSVAAVGVRDDAFDCYLLLKLFDDGLQVVYFALYLVPEMLKLLILNGKM